MRFMHTYAQALYWTCSCLLEIYMVRVANWENVTLCYCECIPVGGGYTVMRF